MTISENQNQLDHHKDLGPVFQKIAEVTKETVGFDAHSIEIHVRSAGPTTIYKAEFSAGQESQAEDLSEDGFEDSVGDSDSDDTAPEEQVFDRGDNRNENNEGDLVDNSGVVTNPEEVGHAEVQVE